MKKTEHLEQEYLNAIGRPEGYAVELVTSEPSCDAAMPQITFPAPAADWGKITHFCMWLPNPKRRWWTFWRPRFICHFAEINWDL